MSFGRAKQDYVARNKKELTVIDGESVQIDSTNGGEWWTVTNSKGETGYVPSDYLESYSDQSDGNQRGRSRSRRSRDDESVVYSITPTSRYKPARQYSLDRVGGRAHNLRSRQQYTSSTIGGPPYAASSLASPGGYGTQLGASLGSGVGASGFPAMSPGYQLQGQLSTAGNPFMPGSSQPFGMSALGSSQPFGMSALGSSQPFGMSALGSSQPFGTSALRSSQPFGLRSSQPFGTSAMGYPGLGSTQRFGVANMPASSFPGIQSAALGGPSIPRMSGFGVPGFGTSAPSVFGAPSTVGAPNRGFRMV